MIDHLHDLFVGQAFFSRLIAHAGQLLLQRVLSSLPPERLVLADEFGSFKRNRLLVLDVVLVGHDHSHRPTASGHRHGLSLSGVDERAKLILCIKRGHGDHVEISKQMLQPY